MTIEVKVPLLPESIADATVSAWHKKVGEAVSRDENIVDLETDKVMLEVPAPADGVLKEIVKNTGEKVLANEVIAVIEEGAKAAASEKPAAKAEKPAAAEKPTATVEKPAEVTKAPPPSAAPKAPAQEPAAAASNLGPAARRAAAEQGTSAATGKATAVGQAAAQPATSQAASTPSFASDRPEQRVPMTRIRTRIAERLLDVTQNTAMLTTFNEINMSSVMDLRNRYRDKFEKKYKVRLGFMSFFVKAVVEALKNAPVVNASIDGNDIVYHGYYDIGIAVSTDRGLVVPVLRDADQMNMADIENKIGEFAEKARAGKLTLEEMQGGTFTITNGGVFGSLMATPIINAPQCAILGMHKIEERPIVVNGQIVAKPMMYVALSYDHRLIDGKESVTFLVAIKEYLEDPSRIILEV